jgi:transposase
LQTLQTRALPVLDAGVNMRPCINWPTIQRELERRGVTLALLWQEHLAVHPSGYSCTRFCELYADWRKQVSPTMRRRHLPGVTLFVD